MPRWRPTADAEYGRPLGVTSAACVEWQKAERDRQPRREFPHLFAAFAEKERAMTRTKAALRVAKPAAPS
jgi:hypothetical protein